jgi:hypothetical protein
MSEEIQTDRLRQARGRAGYIVTEAVLRRLRRAEARMMKLEAALERIRHGEFDDDDHLHMIATEALER